MTMYDFMSKNLSCNRRRQLERADKLLHKAGYRIETFHVESTKPHYVCRVSDCGVEDAVIPYGICGSREHALIFKDLGLAERVCEFFNRIRESLPIECTRFYVSDVERQARIARNMNALGRKATA